MEKRSINQQSRVLEIVIKFVLKGQQRRCVV
jgi:hypothetical protein